MKFKKVVGKTAVCAVLLFFGGVLIIFPDRYLSVCFDGLCLWAESVLPSLFPFMIITLLLIKLGAANVAAKPFGKVSQKLKLPNVGVPLFLMSAFSGYPAGSRILYEYCGQGLIDRSEAKKLAPLLSTCGPLFALGTVGERAFGGNGAGVKLLCACLISVVATSLLYCLFSGRKQPSPPLKTLKADGGDALYSSFYGGVTACLVAGGFICFFYTLSQVIADFNIFKPLALILSPLFGGDAANGLCLGLCEATGGCFAVARAGGFFALPLAGFLLTFGGASILFQQLCYLTKCSVKPAFFIGFKFLQGVLSFALLCLFSLF
ncbi:MAG: hypothetical protein NC033_04160 [Clostridiales bacterium]|nr:hypothetical protein [Clostridiales bacterium]